KICFVGLIAIFCTQTASSRIGVKHLHHSTTIARLSERKTDAVKTPWGGRLQFSLVNIRTRRSLLDTRSESALASVKYWRGLSQGQLRKSAASVLIVRYVQDQRGNLPGPDPLRNRRGRL